MRRHAGPVLFFAGLAIGWTWPLAAQMGDAIPGDAGDNYSFLWNLWWMRHVLATPDLGYFHTTYLFYPFGASIANHPHTALPALVAATLLGRTSIVTAQNLLLLGCVFANMASAYALVWDITRHVRAAIAAGVVFGTSPYLAAHLLGHFDLMAAWLLPAFALLLRRALDNESNRAAAAAGIVFAATAYTAYYYVVYLSLFAAVYTAAWLDAIGVSWEPRAQTAGIRLARSILAGGVAVSASIAVWIISGGHVLFIRPFAILGRTPQNVLTLMWLCLIGCAVLTWRPLVTRRLVPAARTHRALLVAFQIASVFVIAAAPLLWEAARVMARGEYVTQVYHWRSAPRGVDLLALVLGPPAHPLVRTAVDRAYAAAHLDRTEAVGWIGVVPALLLLVRYPSGAASSDVRIWRVVGAAFFLWALGPFLTVDGFDTGLKLPETLVRYIPLAANARMPGRAMVGVLMAVAVLLGIRLSAARGRLHSSVVQWLLIGLIAFEYWDAPVPMTSLDAPAIYRDLAAAPMGSVCEVPFGVGDGLGGVGSQDRRILFYATLHGHPLAGGYIGRMPVDAAERYERMPLTASLLRLSDGQPAGSSMDTDIDSGPCRYLMVNRLASSAALLAYIDQLPLERLARTDDRDLYAVR